MAFTSRLPVRLADVDWARVVYFARYADFAHRCLEDFFAAVGLPFSALLEQRKLGLAIVHSEADFHAPLRLGDTARIVFEVTRLTQRSVTSRFTIFRGETDERLATIVLKQAAIETDHFTGVELPADVHSALANELVR
ncbi:MAG: acyl-CoA thioesterase [Myxococcota bacterium]